MISQKLIQTAIVAVLVAAATGQLTKFTQTVRVAQYQLLKESRSSMWGKPLLLPIQSSDSFPSKMQFHQSR